MNHYHNVEEYMARLEAEAPLPEGFRIGVESLHFTPIERQDGPSASMNMTAIVLDEPSASFAAVYTRNSFPGAPVRLGRKLLDAEKIQGVLVNNKIANVCTPRGEEDALSVLEAFSAAAGSQLQAPLFPSSTGVIGWSLPVKAMQDTCPSLWASLQSESLLPAARSIMTTDAFPKLRSVPLGEGRLSGIAKGAGMIEPNMATMLSFLLTDITLPRDMMRRVLKRVADRTYNRISIDSDQSTSDSVFFLSSCKKDEVSEADLEKALYTLCLQLSEDIVRNGEGTGHVIKVKVCGAVSEAQAAALGKALINSPLSKTAIFGNDPNVGRFIQAIGDYCGNHEIPVDEQTLIVSLGSETIFQKGQFELNSRKEEALSQYLKSCALETPCPSYPQHEKMVEICIDLGVGSEQAEVMGSDLSYEYVRENADYRT